MKPMIIIPPDLMSAEDIELLRQNDLCVVTAKDPGAVKFLDPLPAQSSRTEIEYAAIKLSRVLIHGNWGDYVAHCNIDANDVARVYCKILVEGTPLDRNGTEEEQLKRQRHFAELEEARRLGREDAKLERQKRLEQQKAKTATKAQTPEKGAA